jgi:hypothetical protein
MKRPTRKELIQALDTVPIDSVLGIKGELTHKQKTFARLVASGETGAESYRKAYKSKGKPKTVGNEAVNLKKHPAISREIEAYKLAMEASAYQTPAHLRALVIQTLVQTLIDEDTKHAVKVQAAKVLGSVTEVSAFTEQKVVRVIKSSDDAKAALMARLKEVLNADAVDVETKDGDSLALELNPDSMASLANETSSLDSMNVVHDTASASSSDFGGSDMEYISSNDGDLETIPLNDLPQDASATPIPPFGVRSPVATMHNNVPTQSVKKIKKEKSPHPPIDSADELENELLGKGPLGDSGKNG